MLAPGMTPPDASLTSPVIEAVVTPCADAMPGTNIAQLKRTPITHTRRDLFTWFISGSSCRGVRKGRAILLPGTVTPTQKRPPGCPGGLHRSNLSESSLRASRWYLADARSLLFAQFLRPVAQLVGVLDQLLLFARILLHVRLQAKEQVL